MGETGGKHLQTLETHLNTQSSAVSCCLALIFVFVSYLEIALITPLIWFYCQVPFPALIFFRGTQFPHQLITPSLTRMGLTLFQQS